MSKPETTAGRWQPIETAPQDGSEIFVCFPRQFGGWVMFTATAYPPPHGVKASTGHFATPTHWMPLPEPPL